MPREQGARAQEAILGTLTRIDLYHHSLRLAAEKILAQMAASQEADDSVVLRERALDLIRDCSDLLDTLRGLVYEVEAAAVDSARDTVDLALTRARRASNETLYLVNLWRVVEATGRIVSVLAHKYGYQSLSGDPGDAVNDEPEMEAAELAKLFAEYDDAMAGEPGPVVELGPPFEHGILHWRGSQLFYVQRVEDGARWIELDADREPRVIGEERGGVEIAEASSVQGHQLKLMLDVNLDANIIDEYIRSQTGHEYYVSGYQVAAESQGRGSALRPRRR